MAPFEALAERLFRAGEDVDAAPYKLFQAVQGMRTSYGKLVLAPLPRAKGGTECRDEIDGTDFFGESIAGSTQRRGAPASGHAAPKFDAPPVPNPAPFPIARPRDFEASGHRLTTGASGLPRGRSRTATSERRNTVLEEIERIQLKRDNYAYHCQACLGLHHPGCLTPKFTYLWDKDYRNRNIEAHHVEHLQNEGSLGVGNLLILCQYHHDFLGDKLARDDITRELRAGRQEQRRFPADIGGKKKKTVRGFIIKLPLDVAPYQIPLFFTAEHATAWLDRAKDLPGDDLGLEDAAE